MTKATMEPPRAARSAKAWVLVAVCLGQFMIQLDLTVVNVALPDMARSLGASTSTLQWVADAYNLTVAALLLAGGRAGDRFGHKWTYLAGLVLFGTASALCAAAPTATALLGFRVLQGAGAAIELPATLAILTHTFPDPAERARAVGVWTGAAGSALVVGPVLGGGLVAALGWRAVFVINVPITAAVLVLTVAVVREDRAAEAGLDVTGQILGAAALGLLTAGAIEGGRQGFSRPGSAGLLATGAVASALFVWAEHRSAEPMLPLAYFARPAYTAANAAGVVMGYINIGLVFVLGLFFQQMQHLSAIAAGLRFVPWALTFVLVGPVVGRRIDRLGHRLPMTTGCLLMMVGSLLLIRVGAASGYGSVWWPLVILGAGYGLLSTPMAAAVLAAVPPGRAGMASSTNLTARLVGGVFGVAVLGAFLPSGAGGRIDGPAFVHGLHTGLLVCAVIAAVGAAGNALFVSGRSRPGLRPRILGRGGPCRADSPRRYARGTPKNLRHQKICPLTFRTCNQRRPSPPPRSAPMSGGSRWWSSSG